MPALSWWLRRAASRRAFLRALLGLAAVAGMTATHAGAPGAATPDDGQRQFSKAEILLWQTDHLANVSRPTRLRYRYTKTGTAEEQHTDVIDLEVLRVHPDGQKGVQMHYFTGKQEKPVPEQDPVTGNPVLPVYLQADVYAMNRRTEGGGCRSDTDQYLGPNSWGYWVLYSICSPCYDKSVVARPICQETPFLLHVTY